MNIFVIDEDPEKAAISLMDKHVVKMALETAQMLSTINGGPYKPTHGNHPCTLWAKAGIDNYKWLVKHGLAICDEYMYRFGKVHKCREVIWLLEEPFEITLPSGGTPHALVVPDLYREEDIITSYRNYYMSKAGFAKWTKRNPPEWWLT